MTDRWIKEHTVKVPVGEVLTFNARGGMVHCYYASADIQVSLDAQSWAPFTRGIKIPLPFDRLYFRHAEASVQTVTIVIASDPDAYHDNRELAAQVALDGVSVQVVNSPDIDEGGTVRRLGTSYASVGIDQSGGAGAAAIDIIPAASNTNGIRVRSLRWVWTNVASNGTRQLSVTPNGWRHHYKYYDATADDFTSEYLGECFDLPAGKGLAFDVRDNDVVTAVAFYDIL